MQNELLKRLISSAFLLPIIVLIISEGLIFFKIFILLCYMISISEWNKLERRIIIKIIGILFLSFSFFSFYKLRFYEDNVTYIFLILTICISTDIGGYLFGKILKGPKLTSLSPNKTIAGMIGSYILSIIIIIFFFHLNYFIDNSTTLKFSNVFFIFLVSTVSQIGDIVISSFKRKSNIKDSGRIIPGHGGILDRIDGMIFAFPFSYLVFEFNVYLYF